MVEQKINKLFHDDAGKSDRYGLHASAILASDNDFCLREQVLSLFFKRDTGKEYSTSLLRIFAQGTATHIKWQNMFAEAGWLKCSEYTHFLPEYDLCFTPDMETNWKGDKLDIKITANGVEIKGITDSKVTVYGEEYLK